jgi:hypothetical protein
MQSNVANLRRVAKKTIDTLSQDRLRTATDFLQFLKSMESDQDATEELMRIPGALAEHKRGKRQIANGKSTHWREVRQDV